MDLTEAEDIKKTWQEYTEEICKKDLYDPDKHEQSSGFPCFLQFKSEFGNKQFMI